jgi:hypothetical protein
MIAPLAATRRRSARLLPHAELALNRELLLDLSEIPGVFRAHQPVRFGLPPARAFARTPLERTDHTMNLSSHTDELKTGP